jgi:hypothetical protein
VTDRRDNAADRTDPVYDRRLGGLDARIDCIDCGGVCHLVVNWPEDAVPQPGDIVAYRCVDCHDRWDIVVPWPDEHGAPDSPADDV